MPLTSQIIEDIVRKVIREEIKTELNPVKKDISELKTDGAELKTKVSRIDDTVADIAGQFRDFQDKQTVQSHRISLHNDAVEKIGKKVFGNSYALD